MVFLLYLPAHIIAQFECTLKPPLQKMADTLLLYRLYPLLAENSIIAQELVHKIKSHKGKNGLLLMKIDLKKAYDRLEWSFVDRSLSAWGFSEDFRRIILNCLSSVEYSLLINGDQSKVSPRIED